jgi:hypothetical protein
MRNYPFAISPWARRGAVLSLGVLALSMVAATSIAGPAATPDTTTAADATGATTATTTATTPTPVAGKPDTKPTANKAAAKKPEKESYTVVEADGIKIPQGAFDLYKQVTLKKGQMLILKSASGQMIEVDGPYTGKPVDHYTTISSDGTMGYDAKSFTPPGGSGHCSSSAPHPAGGPNPDETGGAELQSSHCH